MTKKDNIEDFINQILVENYADKSSEIYKNSPLIQYLNLKSKAIHGDSKKRRSLAAWYSIYVLAKSYVNEGFYNNLNKYKKFKGFHYKKIFRMQHKLYGGGKLQNHALNSRTNDEFANKISPGSILIIKHDGKYMLNPKFLYVNGIDISKTICKITETYVNILKNKDELLSKTLKELKKIHSSSKKRDILKGLLNEDAEARVFEIISYAILYSHYKEYEVYIGFDINNLKHKSLKLYKTGVTNANDGGIDFVMKPLGRFFQVTEVDNYDKFLLDIDKVLHFPLTFVVKTKNSKNYVLTSIDKWLQDKYGGIKVEIDSYKKSIEDVITINELDSWIDGVSNENLDQAINKIDEYYNMEMKFNNDYNIF